jgi:hypothetical protein
MDQHTVSPELLNLGHDTVSKVARELATGAPLVHVQLFASHFYEALKDELEQTPRSESAKVGILAAAADHCRRSTTVGIAPAAMLIELKTVIAMLTGTTEACYEPPRFRPQLRVIQGGLA